jgi:aminopeptidase N
MSGERPSAILTQVEAEARAASMQSNLTYKIFVDFRKGEHYSGLVRIEFRLFNKDNVFVDYTGDNVDLILLNGKVDEPKAVNGRISLNKDFLNVEGLNILYIKFSNRYWTDGNGVQTYTDVDGSQYLYTQSEPYWGNRVMPLFDQPDLKAKYILHAASPNDWKVITSVACEYTQTWADFVNQGYGSEYYKLIREHFPEVPVDHTWWQFGSTHPLSTYLQNIVCGPYELINLAPEKRYRGIPMAIYSRQSLLQYAEAESHNIFEFNKKGIEFYESIFNLDYPFGKLDTIFCPEYTVGAMEYPGAVTYTERLLPRNKNTTSMVSLRGSVILHELAHMWFGNAVTMRWWNGLWLNESFADFVCYLAWANIRDKLDFPTYDAWLTFMTRKGWGYKEDQEATTHQIACEVCNTQVADNIFDGITYSKGAASMRQLTALIGEDKFSAALSEYFQNHKWANTDLKDLLDVFQKHLGHLSTHHGSYNMANWQEKWLEKAGLNTVTVDWENNNTSVKLIQGAVLKEHPTLRYHRIDVAFYNDNGDVDLKTNATLNEEEVTEITVEGMNKDVVAVLPNYNDFSFIKVILDEKSLAWFKANLIKVKEPLAVGLVLRALYDGVRDARFKASEFIKVASDYIAKSNDNQLIDLCYTYIAGAIGIIPGSKYAEIAHTLYRATRAKVVSADEPQFLLSMIEKLVGYGFHEDDVEDLKTWLEGTNAELGKHELSLTQKWSIVFKVNGCSKYSAEIGQALFDSHFAADTTDTKKKYQLKIEAVNANAEKREELFKEYFNADTKWSYEELGDSCEGFTSKFVPFEVKQTYFEAFWAQILGAMKSRSRQVASVSLFICKE